MTIDELLKKASPRPWKWTDGDGNDINIESFVPAGYYNNPKLTNGKDNIVSCDEYCIADDRAACAFILVAVNNFERMREALIDIAKHNEPPFIGEKWQGYTLDRAKEALKDIEK